MLVTFWCATESVRSLSDTNIGSEMRGEYLSQMSIDKSIFKGGLLIFYDACTSRKTLNANYQTGSNVFGQSTEESAIFSVNHCFLSKNRNSWLALKLNKLVKSRSTIENTFRTHLTRIN